MTFIPGSRPGCYEIVSAIGVAGMGEVYRAVDSNLSVPDRPPSLFFLQELDTMMGHD